MSRGAARLAAALVVVGLLTLPAQAQTCASVDFLALPLADTRVGPIDTALAAAYPDLTILPDRLSFRTGADERATYDADRTTVHDDPRARLTDATFADQFAYPYPLTFDLTQRTVPWTDPGRVRDDAFFRALWFGTEAEARASLVPVTFDGAEVQATFQVTTRNCVATQLALAFADIADLGSEMDLYFRNVGGSFNWRVIAGTDRLSVHSFGAAIDLNTDLGAYWQWTGATEGDAGPFDNRLPAALVAAFERRGFIWGGKWHHYDGMHFEYRPELILYARLQGERP